MQLLVLIASLVWVVHCLTPGEVNSFFLKAPKSVPRAGRSAPQNFESFFLKASKSVPRVGRRDPYQYEDPYSEDQELLVPEFYEDKESQPGDRNGINYNDILDHYQRYYYPESQEVSKENRPIHRGRRGDLTKELDQVVYQNKN